LALKTGMRQGELLALTWGDVDLIEGVLHVRRTFTDGHLNAPKNHEKREVYVPAEVVDLLGAWWGECSQPADRREAHFPQPEAHVRAARDRARSPDLLALEAPRPLIARRHGPRLRAHGGRDAAARGA
jgi:integrase